MCAPGAVDLIVRRRPEVVFHLAARLAPDGAVGDAVADAEVNVIGSLNVLDGCRAAGVQKIVAASSAAIYGEPDEAALPVKESHPQQPISPFGVSAKAVGDYLRAYRDLHELEYTSLVLAEVYGPRQRVGLVAGFADALLAGEAGVVYGDGEQTRDFVFVDDVVDAFVRAAGRGSGLLLNVGTGVETSVNRLYTAMAGAAAVSAPPVRAPARPGDATRLVLDPARARIHLGWKPWTSLDAGLPEVLKSHRPQP
jgi:UDP-glucose 4-epimerase